MRRRIFYKIVTFFLLAAVLVPPSFALEDISIDATAAFLADVRTGVILYEQNADARVYPASLTKLVTALVVEEHCSYDEVVTVTESALAGKTPDGSNSGLKAGEKQTVETLLYCLLLPSGNDAALVLAEYVGGGSIANFIKMMNEKAAELGCTGTKIANPHGLHDANHYTTARDVYRIAREFVNHSSLMNIANTTSYVIPANDVVRSQRIINSTNHLISGISTLKYLYSYARGIKTGFTTPAGYCLVSSAEKNGLYLISVVMGASRDSNNNIMSFVETKRLFEWGFRNFSTVELVAAGEPVVEVPVSMSQDADSVVAVTKDSIKHLMSNDFDRSQVVITPWLDSDSLTSPVIKGQILGEADVSYKGVSYGRVKLVALSNVERSNFTYSMAKLRDFLRRPEVIYIAVGVVAAVIVYTVVSIVFKRRNRLRRIKKRGRYL